MEIITNTTQSLADMRDLVYFLINEEEEDFPTSFVDRAINEGLKKTTQITDHSPVRAQFDTLVGESMYGIPEAKIENGKALVDQVSVDGVVIWPTIMQPTGSDTGTPGSWQVLGSTIELLPIPDATYEMEVWYRKEFTPLVEDTDETYLSDEMVNAAIKFACYLLKIKDEEFESAQFFKQEWDEARSAILGITTGVYPDYGYGGGL